MTEPRAQLLKVHEVVAITRQSKNSVYAAVNSGQLPAIRLSPRAIRISMEALDKWLHEHAQ